MDDSLKDNLTNINLINLNESSEDHKSTIEDQKSSSNEEPVFINDYNDVNYCLKWCIKSDLINCLNRFSSLIYKDVSPDQLKKYIEDFDHLIIELINLPIKIKKGNILKRKMAEIDQDQEMILDLTTEQKIQIITNLNQNKNLAIYYKDYVSDKFKKKLLNQNNEQIRTLLDLRVSFEDSSEDEVLDENNKVQDNYALDSEFNDFKMKVQNNMEILKKDCMMDFENIRKELKADIETIKNELNLKIEHNYISGTATEFTFELNDFEAFLNSKKVFSSPFFYCAGIAWSIRLRTYRSEEDNTDYLSFFVVCHNDNDNTNWQCKAFYDFELLNKSKQNCLKASALLIYEKNKDSWGRFKFAPLEELKSPVKGYITNNSITTKCNLKIEKFTRTANCEVK